MLNILFLVTPQRWLSGASFLGFSSITSPPLLFHVLWDGRQREYTRQELANLAGT